MTRPSSATIVPDTQHGWVGRLPEFWRDYAILARLDRPIGTWLLLLPCWFGQALASGLPDLWLMICFAVGAFAMRGAGCTINDLADRKFDAKVERTRNRPLASGRVSVVAALLFTALQMLVGLLVLTQIGWFASIIALASVPLIVAYPFMKRITYWPQLFLGITFNWGILVGFAAETQTISVAAIILYIGAIVWTIGYDTIYAHLDKEDDLLVGVKSSALALGENSERAIFLFYGAFWLAALVAGILQGLGWMFFPALALVGWLLLRNVKGLDINDDDDCLRRFRANRNIGFALVFALILGGF